MGWEKQRIDMWQPNHCWLQRLLPEAEHGILGKTFISGVKGIFALSVIFCRRTSSAITRTEASPSLDRALFTSWHGRPPPRDRSWCRMPDSDRGRPYLTPGGNPFYILVPFCASGSGQLWGKGQRRLTISNYKYYNIVKIAT